MSLLLALQGGAPAVSGTVVQGATKGQHVAVGIETFSATLLQRGLPAPTVAIGTETFSGTGVQRGMAAPTVAVGVETFLASGVQGAGVGTHLLAGEVSSGVVGSGVQGAAVGIHWVDGTPIIEAVIVLFAPPAAFAAEGEVGDPPAPVVVTGGLGSGWSGRRLTLPPVWEDIPVPIPAIVGTARGVGGGGWSRAAGVVTPRVVPRITPALVPTHSTVEWASHGPVVPLDDEEELLAVLLLN